MQLRSQVAQAGVDYTVHWTVQLARPYCREKLHYNCGVARICSLLAWVFPAGG
jgi:hypothetical protein